MWHGSALLRLTSLGYGKVMTERFELADAEVRDLGTLRMPVDAVLLDYLRNLMPLSEAQAQLAKMDANAKQLDLGMRLQPAQEPLNLAIELRATAKHHNPYRAVKLR